MKISIRLFVQRLADGSYTVSSPLVQGVSASGPDLDQCKQEMADTLAERLALAQDFPRDAVALDPDERLVPIEVELFPRTAEGVAVAPMRLTMNVMVIPDPDGGLRVTVPRLIDNPIYFRVARPSQLEAVCRSHLIIYFQDYVAEAIAWFGPSPEEWLDEVRVEFTPQNVSDGAPGQASSSETTELAQVGIELTADANEHWLTVAYGRDAEVGKVLGVLGGARPSLVLIGRSGVGKTAILYEAVRRIRAGQCTGALKGRQVWAVTGTSLIADQKYTGEFEGRMQRVVEEVRESGAILFVEDIAGLVDAGRHEQNNTAVSEYLRPFIQSGAIVVIGESTPERWRYAERSQPGFVAQFSTLRIEPTDDAATLKIANCVLPDIERRMRVRFAPGTSEAAVLLTNRFLPYRAHPGKAVRLIEQVAADCLQHAAEQAGAAQAPACSAAVAEWAEDATPVEVSSPLAEVGPEDVAATFTRESGLPEFILADDTPLDLAAVRKHFEERVVGQEHAVDAMVNLIAMVKTGLNDPEKPLGSFLFIGPTGVGKTQMVKALAKYLFGDEQRVIRFDMSEYSDPVGARRLIGLPGSGEEGELTGRVREQPFCVVLLDEFEKAAPEIYDLFLQVLGEGRLTGATGAMTSFQNAIVVMTSNLGGSARDQRAFGLLSEGQTGAASGSGAGRGGDYWLSKVESYFRPEFVNRIDQIVPFQPLGSAAMRTIARRELGEVLLRQGVARRNLLVEIDDSIIDLLLEQGFSAAYGARPLKRAIEQRVVVPLARFLAGRTGLGGELLRLGREDDQVKLTLVRVGPEEGRELGLLETRPRRTQDKSRLLNYADLIEDFAELRAKLEAWNARDSVWELRHERDGRLARTSHPTFWDDPDAAQATLARFYFLERLLKRLQQLLDKAAYLEELARLVHKQRDAGYRWDLAENYDRLARDAAFLEVELLCAHIEKNNGALLTLAPMPRVGVQPGPAQDEDTAAWVRKLAAMYVSWANRKGYDVEAVASLALIPEAQRSGEVQRAYPYRWQRLDTSDCDALVKALGELPEVREIAILLSGANVYGFLKGEAGLHRRAGERIKEDRRDDDRAKDERSGRRPERGYGPLQLVAVSVDAWDGDAGVLDEMIEVRATGKSERGIVVSPAPSEIVRNYHVEGQRYVRDPRTKVRNNDLNGVLAGDLDDFILAYLRNIEPVNAWEG